MRTATQEDLEEALRKAPFPEGATLVMKKGAVDNGEVVWWKGRPSRLQYHHTAYGWRLNAHSEYYKRISRAIPKEFLIDRWLENDNVQK